MARTGEQYRKLLSSLLPKGVFWNKFLNSFMQKTVYGMADELSRIEGRAEDLYDEKDVRTAVELLPEHEEDFGLPDEGDSISTITSKRQDELHAAFLNVGQQFKQFYIDIAAALGYTITIEEFTPFWSGLGGAGDPCGIQNNLFYWRVLIDLDSVTYSSEVNITKLINKISKSMPGHTHLLFEFSGAEFSRAFSRAYDSIPHYDNSWFELEFSRDFSNAFTNAYDYDGVNFTGAFAQAFSIAFDRHSGGNFGRGFGNSFFKPH